MPFVMLLAALAVLAVGAIVLYNRFIALRNLVDEAYSGIDVQLKRRHDLVPKLVDVVKGAGSFEKGLLDQVLKARAQALAAQGLQARGAAEGELGGALGRLLAVAEAYPDLKASRNYLDLQGQLAGLEQDIAMARRYYNACVRDHNTYGQTLPASLLAGAAGFAARPYFQAGEDERAVPGAAL